MGSEDAGAPGPSKPLDYDTVFTNAKVCQALNCSLSMPACSAAHATRAPPIVTFRA